MAKGLYVWRVTMKMIVSQRVTNESSGVLMPQFWVGFVNLYDLSCLDSQVYNACQSPDVTLQGTLDPTHTKPMLLGRDSDD